MQPTPSTVKVIETGFSCSICELMLSPLCATTWLEIISDTGTAVELTMCNKRVLASETMMSSSTVWFTISMHLCKEKYT